MDEANTSNPFHNGEISNGGISNVGIPNAVLANLEVIIHGIYFSLFVSKILRKVRTTRIGTDNWDLETYRNKL